MLDKFRDTYLQPRQPRHRLKGQKAAISPAQGQETTTITQRPSLLSPTGQSTHSTAHHAILSFLQHCLPFPPLRISFSELRAPVPVRLRCPLYTPLYGVLGHNAVVAGAFASYDEDAS